MTKKENQNKPMQEYWCGGAAKAKEQETVFPLPLLLTEVVEQPSRCH